MPETHPQAAVGDQGDAMVAGYAAAADRIETEIGVPRGPVLDIGSNSGAGMDYLKSRWPHAELYGIEPVDKFAHIARERGLNVVTGAAEHIPFHYEFFSLVFSRHSLEHTENRAASICEMGRVLKHGGHLYVQAPLEPGGTPNKLHTSPFESVEEFMLAFGFTEANEDFSMDGEWRAVYWGIQETVAEFIGRKL